MSELKLLARYEVAGVSIVLRGDCRRSAAALTADWSRLAAGSRDADLAYELHLTPRRKRLVRNGRSLYTDSSALEVLDALELDVYRQSSLLSPDTPLHAGGVVCEPGAVLLLGTSGAGKSSLTRELLRGGAAYLSDEQVFVDPEGSVRGLPRAIHIDAPDGTPAPAGSGYLPPRDQVVHQPVQVALIVLLGRPRTVGAGPRPVASSEAAAHLIAAQRRPPRVADLDVLARLACRAPVRSLACERVSQAARAILNEVSGVVEG